MAVSSVFTNLLLPLTTPPAWREKLEIDLTSLGVSSFMQTLLDDASATAALATLGITSGTYTPTLTAALNIDASTAFSTTWLQVGSRVIVSGYLEVDSTAASTQSQLLVSLPIASNFTTIRDGNGAGSMLGMAVVIYADGATDKMRFAWLSTVTANAGLTFAFMYQVL